MCARWRRVDKRLRDVDFARILEQIVYYGMLLGLPAIAVLVYMVLALHHRLRLEERVGELTRMASRRESREARRVEYERLADPLFRFRVGAKRSEEAPVSSSERKTGRVRRTATIKRRETRIADAVAAGKFVLHETALEHVQPGMVIGKAVQLLDGSEIAAGETITPDSLRSIRASGRMTVPILFNPTGDKSESLAPAPA